MHIFISHLEKRDQLFGAFNRLFYWYWTWKGRMSQYAAIFADDLTAGPKCTMPLNKGFDCLAYLLVFGCFQDVVSNENICIQKNRRVIDHRHNILLG